MKKELFFRLFVGLLGGVVISYLITIVISLTIGDGHYYPCVPSLEDRFGNEVTAVIIQTILSAVLGAGFAGSSIIWEKDEWSLLKQTAVYFGIVSVLMMTIAYICEWMEHSVKGVLSYFAIFSILFIIIWIVQYLIWKVRIAKIKRGIQKNH
ncbi:MAG: DUF3021 domain-containing protein [Lachnospiraceae bacterium]|nr:DUF3021 domain-containing protein [Lachnospiraceae bacterium]